MDRRKLLVRAALVLAALPAAELVVRLATGFDSEVARAEIAGAGAWMRGGLAPEDGRAAKGGALRLHPYHGFDDERAAAGLDEALRYFATPEADEVFDVLVLGGSVAGGFGADGGPRLAGILSADPALAGREVRIHTQARAGFKQPQQLLQLAYLLTLGFEPDLVLNLDGFNEVAIGLGNARNELHPLHPSVTHWGRLLSTNEPDERSFEHLVDARVELRRAGELASTALARGYHHSALMTRLTLARLAPIAERGRASYEAFLAALGETGALDGRRGPTFDGDRDAVLQLAADGWARSSRSMADLCAERGIAYLHALQPTLHDEGSKPLTAEERRKGKGSRNWIEGVRHGYPRLREAGLELGRDGVAFFDASQVFAELEEPTYYDVCHFDRVGHRVLADALGREARTLLPESWRSPWAPGAR